MPPVRVRVHACVLVCGSCCEGVIITLDTSIHDYSRLNRVGSARVQRYSRALKADNHAVDISDTSDIALRQQRLRNIEGLLPITHTSHITIKIQFVIFHTTAF